MIKFKSFDINNDFDKVYEFLINNYSYNRENGTEAPFLTYSLGNLKESLINKNTIIYDNDKIIGYLGIELGLGEAYFFFSNDLDSDAIKTIIDYAINNLSVDNHIIMRVYSKQTKLKEELKRLGFSLTGAWKFYDYDYSIDINSSLPKGCKFFDGEIDLIKLKKCIWQGFDNDGDNEDISALEKIIHHKKYSHMDVIVINEDNEYVGYCGVWIEERNKLCYLEPLCVISSYRNKGVGKAIIAEVIRKTKDLGLRRMTGGISDFYKQIGFSSNFRQEIYER